MPGFTSACLVPRIGHVEGRPDTAPASAPSVNGRHSSVRNGVAPWGQASHSHSTLESPRGPGKSSQWVSEEAGGRWDFQGEERESRSGRRGP